MQKYLGLIDTETEDFLIVTFSCSMFVTDLKENITYPSKVYFAFGLFLSLNNINLTRSEQNHVCLQNPDPNMLFPFPFNLSKQL